jgi:ClpP class serine protease
VAYPTTVTGSIGVILQTITFKPAMARVGIEAEAFVSGPNKAAGSPIGDMTDEHRAVLQGMVDDFYQRFRAVVRERRPNIPADKFDMVTDGRVLTGDDALALGVVDQLGDLYDAFDAAKQRAGVTSAALIRYHRPDEFVPSPYYAAPATPTGNVGGTSGGYSGGGTQVNLVQFNFNSGYPIGATSAGFYYLWSPPMP